MYVYAGLGREKFQKQNFGSLEYAEQERIFTQSCNGIVTFKYSDSLALRIAVLVSLDTLRELLGKLSPEESYDFLWSWSCYQLLERRFRSGDVICHNRVSSLRNRLRNLASGWVDRVSRSFGETDIPTGSRLEETSSIGQKVQLIFS